MLKKRNVNNDPIKNGTLKILDHDVNDDDDWFDAQEDLPLLNKLFNNEGNYVHEASFHNIVVDHLDSDAHLLPDPMHHLNCDESETIKNDA